MESNFYVENRIIHNWTGMYILFAVGMAVIQVIFMVQLVFMIVIARLKMISNIQIELLNFEWQ